MIESFVKWAIENRLVVVLSSLVLCGVGGYAFMNINVEAYPDPAPAIIEVVAQYPGASAEEVERQVTIPLEVALPVRLDSRRLVASRCLDWLTSATSSTITLRSKMPAWKY